MVIESIFKYEKRTRVVQWCRHSDTPEWKYE